MEFINNNIKIENKFYQFGYYTGDWDKTTNQPNGNGQFKRLDVILYDGGWIQGKWNGVGTVYDQNSGLKVCTGQFFNGELHGYGTLFKEDGEIEEESYHIFGKEMPMIKSKEEFEAKVEEILREREEKARVRKAASTITSPSFSMTLDSSSPVMTAPIVGLFPRYESIPIKMLEGAQFSDLDDDEIPTPSNLDEGKTRQDWLTWVRTYYPKTTI